VTEYQTREAILTRLFGGWLGYSETARHIARFHEMGYRRLGNFEQAVYWQQQADRIETEG